MIEDFTKYPRFLYQYLKFDKNFKNNLKNNELWFSDFTKFNDPYDCQIVFDRDNTLEEIILFLHRINESKIHKLSNDQIVYRAKQIFYNENGEKDKLNTVRKRNIANYRILCLSKTRSNNIMWSHYAEKHTGICIKFDIHKDPLFFMFPLKVKYVLNYPKLNYLREHDSSPHIEIFRTKYYHWKYEKEFRIIKNIKETNFKNEGLLKYNKNALVEINFGLKTTNENISIVELINSEVYNNKIKLRKAIMKDFSYEIKFIKIK